MRVHICTRGVCRGRYSRSQYERKTVYCGFRCGHNCLTWWTIIFWSPQKAQTVTYWDGEGLKRRAGRQNKGCITMTKGARKNKETKKRLNVGINRQTGKHTVWTSSTRYGPTGRETQIRRENLHNKTGSRTKAYKPQSRHKLLMTI